MKKGEIFPRRAAATHGRSRAAAGDRLTLTSFGSPSVGEIFPTNQLEHKPKIQEDSSEQRERVIEAEGNCDGTACSRCRCYSS
ncbi:MAG: hypothetical protein LBQ54_05275 [Planctomycetaceae bacterium]|nr:hypothetical protein [Planctomycetaceae bacterium]